MLLDSIWAKKNSQTRSLLFTELLIIMVLWNIQLFPYYVNVSALYDIKMKVETLNVSASFYIRKRIMIQAKNRTLSPPK